MNNKIEKIQVFGSGCPSCKKLFELTKQVVGELEITTEVEYVTDLQKIMKLGVMTLPILAINDQVVSAGVIPKPEKLKKLISDYQPKNSNTTPKSGCSCGLGCCC
ncbi:MAG: thioredoxin family protein [Candidatus Buchananbacteria bacterium]